ncbi:uncharacterized protein LOC127791699 [Diospyros lotus]|uniref:uncharacterized protein LOC127791699 n=1 Tax=Diospyros lotus TaxID=55363 RepID=UPI00224ED6AF|nr:uncharacterized protein LOC127791699 [Diospyros lotus]
MDYYTKLLTENWDEFEEEQDSYLEKEYDAQTREDMDRYFKRKSLFSIEENSGVKKISVKVDDNHDIQENDYTHKASIEENSEAKKASVEEENHIEENEQVNKGSIEQIDIAQLSTYPGLRTPIMDYNVNLRDQIRRVYLQRANNGEQGNGDSFVKEGFSNFKKKDRLQVHVGDVNSAHNQARSNCEALINQEKNIESVFFRQSEQIRCDYRIHLNASINCIQLLLQQGLAFRGHDESEDSNNQGNFLELLQFLANHNKEIKVVTLKNAPENLKLTSPDVQKDIVQATVIETIDLIIKDVGDAFFSILIDESRDISIKEQMSIVLCYVNTTRHVVEWFIGIEHISIVAKKHVQVTSLFNLVSRVVNIVGASSKRCDLLREKQEAIIFEALNNGEISSVRGLNQQSTITRFGDTRWGSHYGPLISLISMFSPIVDILEMIVDDGFTE